VKTVTDTVLHIPPDNDEPPHDARWIVPLVVIVGAFAIGLLVVQTRPLAPAYRWSMVDGPDGPVNLDSLIADGNSVAVLSGIADRGVSIWWSNDAGQWRRQLLDGSPTQLAAGDGRVAAYRVRSGAVIALEGERWVVESEIEFPAETRSRQASGRPSIVVTANGLLEMSLYGDVWWSRGDGDFTLVIEDPAWGQGVETRFESACRPPSRSSPDVPPYVVADGTMLALGPSNTDEPFGIWPVCEPVVWSTSDGSNWSVKPTSLGKDSLYVYDLAWRDGVLIAVGGYAIGEPAVWASDDGIEWAEITPDTAGAVDLYRVEAGPAGWVILGHDNLESRPVGWTSSDGLCWEPLPHPVSGGEAVVTGNNILLVDRTDLPGMWLATPTGSAGACR
jgi:hypothetical protein